MFYNIETKQLSEVLPTWMKETQTSNPPLEMCAKIGWRKCLPVPDPKPGYERLTPVSWKQGVEFLTAEPVVADSLIADRVAAEEKAAQDEAKARADAEAAYLAEIARRDGIISALTFKSFNEEQQKELTALRDVIAQIIRGTL